MSILFDADQLQSFVAIVESGSFTRAADMVHKTQSAVSMQIKRLEERTGKALFERDGRTMRLTEDGERLLDYARRIVILNKEAAGLFSTREVRGRVRLGIPDDYADRYLPEILSGFSFEHQLAEVTVLCEPSRELTEKLRNQDIDMAIITVSDDHPADVILRQEPLLWVTSLRSCAHAQTPLPLAVGRPICCWRTHATEALARVARPYRILYSSWSSVAVNAAVSAGLAVGVLPESALKPGMRVLGEAEGFPPLPPARIGLIMAAGQKTPVIDALHHHIIRRLTSGVISDAAF